MNQVNSIPNKQLQIQNKLFTESLDLNHSKLFLFKKCRELAINHNAQVFIAIKDCSGSISVFATNDNPSEFIATHLRLPLHVKEIITRHSLEQGTETESSGDSKEEFNKNDTIKLKMRTDGQMINDNKANTINSTNQNNICSQGQTFSVSTDPGISTNQEYPTIQNNGRNFKILFPSFVDNQNKKMMLESNQLNSNNFKYGKFPFMSGDYNHAPFFQKDKFSQSKAEFIKQQKQNNATNNNPVNNGNRHKARNNSNTNEGSTSQSHSRRIMNSPKKSKRNKFSINNLPSLKIKPRNKTKAENNVLNTNPNANTLTNNGIINNILYPTFNITNEKAKQSFPQNVFHQNGEDEPMINLDQITALTLDNFENGLIFSINNGNTRGKEYNTTTNNNVSPIKDTVMNDADNFMLFDNGRNDIFYNYSPSRNSLNFGE